MNHKPTSSQTIQDTGIYYAMKRIQGKYKVFILYILSQQEFVRFNEIKRRIPGITFKSLTTALKELENDSLIHRHAYPEIPPRVEYSLTDLGKSILPPLQMLCRWGNEHKNDEEKKSGNSLIFFSIHP